jgi:type IV pilus assembly protein PilC
MATKTFSYEALDATGALLKGKIDSESAAAAANALADQRLVPLAVSGAGEGLQKEIKLPGFKGRTTLKDLAVLSRQFASMTSSGLTMLRSLSILEDQATKPKMKAALA